MLLSKSYSPFFFHIHTEDQPVALDKTTVGLNFFFFFFVHGGKWEVNCAPTGIVTTLMIIKKKTTLHHINEYFKFILIAWHFCYKKHITFYHYCFWLVFKLYYLPVNLHLIFTEQLTFAQQDVVGQDEEGWHGAIHGWLQYSLGIVHGCLHSSSIRHSPLWQILLHLCIPHFNIWLQRSPQEMSVRWQGILLRSWKRRGERQHKRKSIIITANLKALLLFTPLFGIIHTKNVILKHLAQRLCCLCHMNTRGIKDKTFPI